MSSSTLKRWLPALASAATLAAASAVSANWIVSGSAHSSANDPPAGASNPADLTYNQVMAPGANQRAWVPNPPANEANWNNDNYLFQGLVSWHNATSGATEAQSKAKSGLGNNDQLIADARARVRDILDSNLANNGADNSAHSNSVASVQTQLQVVVHGPVGGADPVLMTVHNDVYMGATTSTGPAMAPYTGSDANLVPVGVGTPLSLGLTSTASAGYPFNFQLQPGSLVHYGVSVNDSTVSSGDVMYTPVSPTPVPTGDLADMSFATWTAPGPQGQWYEDADGSGFYGAIYTTFGLPDGYSFQVVPEPAMLTICGLAAALLLRQRRIGC